MNERAANSTFALGRSGRGMVPWFRYLRSVNWHWRHRHYRSFLAWLWRHEYGGWDPVADAQSERDREVW